jgi:outer membrane protein assembly factor BamB
VILQAKIVRFALELALCLTSVSAASPSEWLTWGYDQERTDWNQAETTLAPGNVAQLELKWKAQLPTQSSEVVLSTLTAPLVATVNTPQGPRSRVFVVGSDNTVYSIDAETVKVTWQRRFPNTPNSETSRDLAVFQHSECHAGHR